MISCRVPSEAKFSNLPFLLPTRPVSHTYPYVNHVLVLTWKDVHLVVARISGSDLRFSSTWINELSNNTKDTESKKLVEVSSVERCDG